jgi:excisionase family DNA binding protein
MAKETAVPGELTRLLTPDEVAALLGVPRLTVIRLSKAGKIPALKIGRRRDIEQRPSHRGSLSESGYPKAMTPPSSARNPSVYACFQRLKHGIEIALTAF